MTQYQLHRRRGDRPDQVRLPRPQDADDDRTSVVRRIREGRGVDARPRHAAARRQADLPAARQGRHRRRLPDGIAAACASWSPSCGRRRFEDIIAVARALPARAARQRHGRGFIERKHGKEEIDVPAPGARADPRETYGVIVYQEQVMQIAQVLAGYSLGDADNLRRAMGKKKTPRRWTKERERFLAGAVAAARSREARRPRSSTRWRPSPRTASTSRTPPPTP